MRLRDLAMRLSALPTPPSAGPEDEAWNTEGDLAARWLEIAFRLGDLTKGPIADLGAGGGILGIGAHLISGKPVLLIERNQERAASSVFAAKSLGLTTGEIKGWPPIHGNWPKEDSPKVTILNANIDEKWPDILQPATILMNPPFGTINRGADRPLMVAAFTSNAKAIHILHAATASHIERLAEEYGWNSEVIFDAEYRLPATQIYHRSSAKKTQVRGWRCLRYSS